MIYPTFIEFFDSMPKCNRELHTANTVHLKPYSDEVYSFILPDGYNSIYGAFIVDGKGNQRPLNNLSLNLINNKTVLNISNIMYYFNGVRTSCPELPEIPDLQACENFISTDVWVSKNYNDKDENNIDLSVYVIGNRQRNEIIGDGNNNIINSNINV